MKLAVFLVCLNVTLVLSNPDLNLTDCFPCICLGTGQQVVATYCDGNETKIPLTQLPNNLNPNLTTLDLTGHVFLVIHNDEFAERNLLNLNVLKMIDCKIHLLQENCFRNLSLLEKIYLSSNFIEDLNSVTFTNTKKLKELIINDNRLRRINENTFAELEELKLLDLSSNLISYVEDGAFRNNKALKTIFLDNNLLIFLPPNTFEGLNNVRELSLYNNPWNCNCELLSFIKNTQNLSSEAVLDRSTNCTSPPWLAGKNWTSLTPQELVCNDQHIFIDSRRSIKFASVGENVVLSCIVRGYANSDAHWTYNKKIVDECEEDKQCNERSFVVNRDIKDGVGYINLTVVNASNERSGLYGCIFMNQLKREEQYVVLIVDSTTTKSSKSQKSLPKYGSGGSANAYLIVASVMFFIAFVVATIFAVVYQKRYVREAKQNYQPVRCDDSVEGCGRIGYPNDLRILETMELG